MEFGPSRRWAGWTAHRRVRWVVRHYHETCFLTRSTVRDIFVTQRLINFTSRQDKQHHGDRGGAADTVPARPAARTPSPPAARSGADPLARWRRGLVPAVPGARRAARGRLLRGACLS